jgi:hypothetical protein
LLSREENDWSRVDFRGLAVAVRLRNGDGSHAKEALEVALAEVRSRAKAAGATSQFIVGRIDKANTPSQRLCRAAGFECLSDKEGTTLQYWATSFDLT